MDGFYSIRFAAMGSLGFGVIHVSNGRFYGGGTTIYYTGSYESDGASVRARLKSGRHASVPGISSIVGFDEGEFDIDAVYDGSSIRGTAQSSALPGVVIHVTMDPIKADTPALA